MWILLQPEGEFSRDVQQSIDKQNMLISRGQVLMNKENFKEKVRRFIPTSPIRGESPFAAWHPKADALSKAGNEDQNKRRVKSRHRWQMENYDVDVFL